MSNISHDMRSLSTETSQLASPEEHASFTGGNLAPPTSPFSDGVDVKPLNNISQSMQVTFAETSPLPTANRHKSLTGGGDVPLDNTLGSLGSSYAESSLLAVAKDHRSPFGDGGVDVKPLNNVSHCIGLSLAETSPLGAATEHESLTSGNLATPTFPFVDGVDVPLNNTSRSFGLLNAESSQLATEAELSLTSGNLATPASPFSDDVDVNPLNNISQGLRLSSAETSQLATAKELSLTSANLATPSLPFSDEVDVKSLNYISCSVDLSSVETHPLAMSEEHWSSTCVNLETPTSVSTNGVEVRSSNVISQGMGLSFAETNPLAMSEEHMSLTSGNLLTPTSPSSHGVDIGPLNKKLSPSSPSSSPDSTLDDPFGGEVHDETQKSAPITTSFQKHDTDAQECNISRETPASCNVVQKLKSTISELPISRPPTEVASHCEPTISQVPISRAVMEVASHPSTRANNLPTAESPPKQVMECPATSKYRIPSHVFARTKSNAPIECSIASNESLFSIHMGNSFTTDHFSCRSGDLGAPGHVILPGYKLDYSSIKSPLNKAAVGNSQDLGIKEADIETMKEVSQATHDQSPEKHIAEGRISQYSEESAISTKSFQVPILTDVDKCTSISITCSAELGTTHQKTESQTLTAAKSTEAQPSEPNASPAIQPQARTNWFPCLLCCSLWH